MQDLEGHIALVTGGTTGIDGAISSLLQALGARVAATYYHDAERELSQPAPGSGPIPFL